MRNTIAFMIILLIALNAQALFAQADGDYQTRVGANGNWTAATTWQKYAGGIWTDVATYPTSADGAITILGDAIIAYDTAVVGGVDQLVVNGSFTINSGISFVTANGLGDEVTVNGTFVHKGLVPAMAGTGKLNAGAVYVHNTTSSANNILNFFSSIDANSTWIYRGTSALTPAVGLSNRTYGNLEFEATSGSWTTTWSGVGVTTVNGNFKLGSNVTINHSNTGINVMKGNYTVDGTIVYGAGTQSISFQGIDKTIGGSNVVAFESAEIAVGGVYSLTNHINTTSGFTFAIKGTLGCGGFTFIGAGNFSLADGGTFKICHPLGIDGNVQVTGSKNFSFSGNYEFYGGANQVTGASFPVIVNNLTINSDYTVSLSNTLVVSGTIHFTKGFLALGNFLLAGNGVATGDPDIVFNGTGAVNNLGSNIDAFISTLTPSALPAVLDSLVVQTGIGNNFILPNDVTTSNLTFLSGGLILNDNSLILAGKDISFHAPNNTTYVTSLVVTKTNSPALANGGDQSISRLWNISGLSSAPVYVTVSWPTPAADAGIVFTDDEGTLWNFTGGSWNSLGLVDITTALGIRSVEFPLTLGAKDINGDYTISGDGQTLPVELSGFFATTTAQNFVQISWISQSETNLLGYRVYRNSTADYSSAVSITPALIPATNTSTEQNYSITDREVTIGNTYYYWLESVDMGSNSLFGPTSVLLQGEVPPVIPETTIMRNAYPNPFAATGNTNIEVSLKSGENGVVNIYNISGQLVKTYTVAEGQNNLVWNGRDTKGNACGSGIYFYKLSTPSLNQTKKLVIMK